MVTHAKRFLSDQTGTTAIEYALIAVGISVAILASVQLVGSDVLALYDRIAGVVATF
jgi:pilus assembly protein Flp/PilA